MCSGGARRTDRYVACGTPWRTRLSPSWRRQQPQGINGLIFALEGDLIYGQSFLTVQLPSGRKLYYCRPFLKENQFGKTAIHYHTMGQQTRKWEVTSTYGGKMTENIVQAIARDCLAATLERIAARGLQVVFHVHDEVIIDAPMETTVDEIWRPDGRTDTLGAGAGT